MKNFIVTYVDGHGGAETTAYVEAPSGRCAIARIIEEHPAAKPVAVYVKEYKGMPAQKPSGASTRK